MSFNFNSWNDKIQVIKGNLGESIVEKYMKDHNMELYKPASEGPHSIDRMAIPKDGSKPH